jgi:hypothetical protein
MPIIWVLVSSMCSASGCIPLPEIPLLDVPNAAGGMEQCERLENAMMWPKRPPSDLNNKWIIATCDTR